MTADSGGPVPAPGPGTGGAWLFDVDGSLVDSLTGTSLRPLAREVLVAVAAAGRDVLVWSAGGGDYARRVVDRHALGGLVRGFFDKERRGGDGRWPLPASLGDVRVVCVDDRPEEVPVSAELIAVPPYLAPDPHDRGLLCALVAASRLCA